MVFLKRIRRIKNNKQRLIDWLGYTDIDEIVLEGEFANRRDAYRYAKNEYNKFVDTFNQTERDRIIVNPLTGSNIKKYSIYKLNGSLKKKYSENLIIENGILKVNPVIIGINLGTLDIAKINLQETDDPQLTQIFGVPMNKDQIKEDAIIEGIQFKHSIPAFESVDVILVVSFTASFSDEVVTRTITKAGVYNGEELSDPTLPFEIVKQDDVFSTVQNITILDMKILATLNNAEMELTNMVLKESNPVNIGSIYNEIIENKNGKCIQDYMLPRYPKLSKEKILKLKTTEDIYDWCKSYDIKMVAHDINGTIIKSYYPQKKNTLKQMVFIAWNSHLYPHKNPTLNKVKPSDLKVVIIENVKAKLISELENGILPSKINIDRDGDISSFVSTKEKIHYTNNKDYFVCLDILGKYGLKDKMSIFTKVSHLGNIIETVYNNKIKSDSFFPYGSEFNKGGYNYENLDIELEEDEFYQTSDKVKSYPSNLARLTKLIVCDIKYHRSRKIDESQFQHKIVDTYLYIAEIDNPTVLLPNNHIYTGQLLRIARKYGFKFRIVEEQETTTTQNYFKEMVYDLYTKVDNATFKEIMNIHIGKFERSSTLLSDTLSFDKVLGKEELKCYDGHTFPLTEEYSIGCQTYNKTNLFNKKPISIQIKDASRLQLYEKMVHLGLKNCDIKQVKTDSVTFKTKNDDYKKWLSSELTGWKTADYVPLKNICIMKRDLPTFEYKTYSGTDYDTFKKSGMIGLGNAGNGKSYKIINEIIPTIDDYLVLTPTWTTAEEYERLNLNVDVIQTYTYSGKIPDQQNIIIDEVGMICENGWNMLVKCKLNGKNIMVFGDNTQLKPINSRVCTNKNFYNLMFNKQITLNNNYRNNFTEEYYDYLRALITDMRLASVEDKQKRLDEILKHNTNFDEAEVIIAYTNSTRRLYNKKMCEKLGIKNRFQIGTKIICKTNDFRKLKICNNKLFTVKDYNTEEVIITDSNNKEFKIPTKKFNKKVWNKNTEAYDYNNFDYAYCRTLHSVQGKSLNSFHFAIEDIDHLDGTALYTLISRLKQEIISH